MNRLWRKPPPHLWVVLLLSLCALLFLIHLHLYGHSPLLLSREAQLHSERRPLNAPHPPLRHCNFSHGRWVRGRRTVHYNGSCPFHRNAWNCLRNGREGMEGINSWVWVPEGCGDGGASAGEVDVDPAAFLGAMRGRRIGFVGDSLNENFLVSFLCILRSTDSGARKWKRKGAWRGGYFPRFDVTVAYHRAVLLARYLWGPDKFPKETPLVLYKGGKPIFPPLGILDGLQVVLKNMVRYIEREVPRDTLKFWRTQSPRHFYDGEWNQNGSCLFKEPIEESQLHTWFDPRNKGVNKEERQVNNLIEQSLVGADIQLLNITHLSEFRADAHPAVWLGKKDAVAIWG